LFTLLGSSASGWARPAREEQQLQAMQRAQAARATAWPRCRSRPLPQGSAEELGVDATLAVDLDAALRDAVARHIAESAALVVVRRGKIFYCGAAGGARTDSLFDVASLTKVVATAPSVLQLVARGRLDLEDRVSQRLPLFATDEKNGITVRQLLLHTAGLHSVVSAGPLSDGRERILSRIRTSALRYAPGTSYRYSDLGYITLGELVQAVAGVPLDAYATKEIFEPLGMCDTGFVPHGERLRRVVSPWPGGGLAGLVYDPLAARMGGVAGHAGLFSTALDLARFGLMMLERGSLEGRRVLGERTVEAMTRPQPLPGRDGQSRGLGWDLSSPHTRDKGHLSSAAFGHTGFTGTSLWIDPMHQLVIVLLTNRTFFENLPRVRAPSVSGLRRRIHDLIVAALTRPARPAVETGLDRLLKSGGALLKGRRVALITNRTAVDSRGRWIGDALLETQGAWGGKLVALFVPEHGLGARLDRRIGDSALVHGGRRIPVYSLFGGRRRPTEDTLRGVDSLVIDLQTVGVRYYTYLATMGWAMEEAAKRKLRFVVLDRPNPIGGLAVQGPVSSAARRTSTNYHPLPVRYGMTLGELARLFAGERHLGVDLQVMKASGWRRDQLFSETGLPWVAPSPNIRSWRQAVLYAGVGLLESTNLSVGRGTECPFQVIGAPWIDGAALASSMNRHALPGLYFTATTFTPSENPHRGQICHGVRVLLLDATVANPPVAGIALAVELRRRYRELWETRNLFRLINHPPTTEALLAGKGVTDIVPLWTSGLEEFRRIRKKYLLY
jgi:uncharacterized protein YbbC (DUF1343 family)